MCILIKIILLLLAFLKEINSLIYYTPFNLKHSDSKSIIILNTVYGTGNKLYDVTYRTYCSLLHNKSSYSDDFCCIGNNLNILEPVSIKKCKSFQNNFRNYFIKITIFSYFFLTFLTMIILFIIFYVNTNDNKFKIKNGLIAAFIVFCGALVIPIIIIEIYCVIKGKEIFKLFGGDYNKFFCFIDIKLQSVDIKNEDYINFKKKISRNYYNNSSSENFNLKSKNFNNDNNYRKKSFDEKYDKNFIEKNIIDDNNKNNINEDYINSEKENETELIGDDDENNNNNNIDNNNNNSENNNNNNKINNENINKNERNSSEK